MMFKFVIKSADGWYLNTDGWFTPDITKALLIDKRQEATDSLQQGERIMAVQVTILELP